MGDVKFLHGESREIAVSHLRDLLQKFESGELTNYSIVASFANRDMLHIHSQSSSLFEELALATYHAHCIMRRIEGRKA
jgi:hypothetical protein